MRLAWGSLVLWFTLCVTLAFLVGFFRGVAVSASSHSAESCGRMLVRRAEKAYRQGGGVVHYPSGARCPRLRLPSGYRIDPTGMPNVLTVYRDDGTRLVRLQPKLPPKHGVYGQEIWENGRLVGKLVVRE